MSYDGSKSPANEVMARLIALENRTGYTMQQFNGQRKFWNPKWDKPIPPRGCEVFVGKIPRDLFEDELVPVFEKIGKVYELRLMMDFSGFNRGYAFVAYTCREHAQMAINQLDNYEVRPGMRIGVCRSVDNCRLFVGGIPKDKSQQEIRQAMCEISDDVSNVIVYPGSAIGELNRGFAFVEYSTHRAAAMARRKLIPCHITLFGSEIVTDWAEPEVDTTDNTSRIKNVYVRNLKSTTTELQVYTAFNTIRPGAIERVKKIEDRDYAFVHFQRREDALYAVQVMNGQRIDGQEIQVSLAKPPSNKRDTANSALQPMQQRASVVPTHLSMYDRMNNMMLPKTAQQPYLQSVNSNQSDYNNLGQSQAAMKLQQSLRLLQSSALPPPYLMKTPPPISSIYSPSESSITGSSKDHLCAPRPKTDSKNNLTPVSTLDHIAKIDCPVVYLDEVSMIFNNGDRPKYSLLTDGCRGSTQYVYQVSFMGETYTPTPEHYSYNITEAHKKAATYVLQQIDPWMKRKIVEMVNGNNGYLTKQTNGYGNQKTTSESYSGTSAWGTVEKPSYDLDSIRNGSFKMSTTTTTSFPKPTSDNFNITPPSPVVTSSLGLTNGLWNQMKYVNGLDDKSSVDYTSYCSKSSNTLSANSRSQLSMSAFSQTGSAFDRMSNTTDRLSSLTFNL